MDRALNVTVCILTFRRPDGLARLLGALQRQLHDPRRAYELTVLVVDNDAAQSAEATVDKYSTSPAYNVHYVVEPRQGIPLARNRALDSAPAGTDLVCFIDDDEWPVETWIDSMLAVRERTDADCVYGPVEPVYPTNAPAWFVRSGVFERKRNADGARIGYAASNNVMMDLGFVRAQRLRFEEKMRFTGGSDYLFFAQAVKRGMRVHWADEALVYDIVPPSRLTWKWVLQRQFRLGNTFAIGDAIDGGWQRSAYRLFYGAGRMGLGALMLPAMLVSPHWGMRALTHLLRGAGAVSGALGYSFKEYSPARLSGA